MASIEGRLAALLERVRKRWPEVELPQSVFVPALTRAAQGKAGSAFLDTPHAEDLCLALASGRGDPHAMAAFESELFGEVEAAAAKEGLDAGELKQVLRERLFASPGRASRVADYSGQARLRTWFRVVVSRLIMDLGKHEKRGRAALSQALPEQLPGSDPELEYMRHKYRRDFEAAFRGAVQALAPKERNLLWYAAVKGNTVDEIASIYGIHRSSAARWVADARKTLMQGTRDALRAELNLSEAELQSILNLVRSHLQLSLSRILSAPK
jgi:RNA polymerase sigma-70 factor (ECF subfamily)